MIFATNQHKLKNRSTSEVERFLYVVSVGKKAVRKVISDPNLSAEKLAVLLDIENVIASGEYVGSGEYEQKGKQKLSERYDYFETPVTINGQDYVVAFDVEVFPNTNNYRTHKVINEMDLIPVSNADVDPEPTANIHPPASAVTGAESNPDNSIPQSEGKSNTQFVGNEAEGFEGFENAERASHQSPAAAVPDMQGSLEDGAADVPVSESGEQRGGIGTVPASSEAKAQAERLGAALGRRVVWYNAETDPENADARGYYDDGVIYINEYATDPAAVIFGHEVFHSLPEADRRAIAEFIWENSNTETEAFRSYRAEREARYKARYAREGRVFTEADFREEFAAENMETFFSGEQGQQLIDKLTRENRTLAQRLLNVIRDVLARIGEVFRPKSYTGQASTATEVSGLSDEVLRRAERMLERALMRDSVPSEGVRFAYAGDAKNQIYDYTKSFAEQLEDYKKGRIPQNDSLLVGATPDVFQEIGFNPLPVTINQQHVDYAINGTKDIDHTIGESLLKQLPQALEEPVAIIKSQTQPGRVVAILKMEHNGKNVIVPIEIDGYGTQNNVRIDSNAITSIFGKSNAITKLLTDAVNDESNGKTSVFYWDKKEALSLLQRPGLQLPNRLPQDGFIHSIDENGANVNKKFKNVTETQQFKRWFGESKVVNKDGTPKVVYHGTNKKFRIFDLSQSGKNYGDTSEGLFFFTNKKDAYPDSASDYAKESTKKNGGEEVIYEVYLSIKKPLRIDSRGYYSTTSYFDANHETIYNKYLAGDYDGIIIENSDKSSDDGIMYLVDNATQIKSATENIGTFDGKNPDIHYALPSGGGQRRSQFYDSVQEAETVDDTLKRMVEDNRDLFTYEPVTKEEQNGLAVAAYYKIMFHRT